MAAWGYTQEDDGTDGQQPRFTHVARNYVREIGLIQKQSSMWSQAKTCQAVLEANIAFNGPRAGINFKCARAARTLPSRIRCPRLAACWTEGTCARQ